MTDGPVIAVFLGAQALGDFVKYHLTAASVARAIPDSRLYVIYRDDRPYKSLCTRLNPYVVDSAVLPPDTAQVAPLDWLDGDSPLPRPDLLLTPSMLEINRCLGRPPAFRFPDGEVEPLARRLRDHGVDPDRWFAVLHVRESGYTFRKGVDAARCADPLSYLPAIEALIEEHGGQVVRIGDSSMTELPAMAGLVDLSRTGDFADQAFALSRARFFIGTDSGPTQLACAFKTPAATTNAVQFGVWNDGDVALAKRFRIPGGRRVSTGELMDMGALNAHGKRPGGLEQSDNTADELRAVAEHMLAATADSPAWRPPAKEVPAMPEEVVIPLAWRAMTDIGRVEVWP